MGRNLKDITPIDPPHQPGVYFVLSGGRVKIGVAENVYARLRALRTMCPHDIDLLAIVDGGADVEQALHLRFAHHRLHGEWFEPADEIVAFIVEAREGAPPPATDDEPYRRDVVVAQRRANEAIRRLSRRADRLPPPPITDEDVERVRAARAERGQVVAIDAETDTEHFDAAGKYGMVVG